MTKRLTSPLTERQLFLRGALRPGGLGVAASFDGVALRQASAQEATPTAAATNGSQPEQDGLAVEVIELVDLLPGMKRLKFWAPPDAGRPACSAAFEPDRECDLHAGSRTPRRLGRLRTAVNLRSWDTRRRSRTHVRSTRSPERPVAARQTTA